MALEIEDPEIERLALELSRREGLSVEDTVRKLLSEATKPRSVKIDEWFESRMRARIPEGEFGRTLTKEETEEILGLDV